jgi:hypothetical protein
VFSGTGSQTVFTLASDPGALGNSAQVYIGGVYQQRSTYTIGGTTLTFSSAPVSGTDNIEFVNFLTSNIGATSADLVTYTPSGTGAVARSAASKFGETVSVKDFGAVGNGVTDDTVAVQACVDAAKNGTNKNIYIPSGTYLISHVDMIGLAYSNLTFIGEGMPTFVFKLPAGGRQTIAGYPNPTFARSNLADGMFVLDANSANQFTNDANSIKNVTFIGIKFQMNVAVDGFDELMHCVCASGTSGLYFDHCQFIGFMGDGIAVCRGRGTGPVVGSCPSYGYNANTVVTNCIFDGVNKDNRQGISIYYCDGFSISDCVFKNITKTGMPGAICLESDSNLTTTRCGLITRNTFDNIGGSGGIVILPYHNATIPMRQIEVSHNVFTNITNYSWFAGVYGGVTQIPATHSCEFLFRYNNCSGVGMAFGLNLLDGAIVEGNTFKNATTTGVFQVANCNNTQIISNDFDTVAATPSSPNLAGLAISSTGNNRVDVIGNRFFNMGWTAIYAGKGAVGRVANNEFISSTNANPWCVFSASGTVEEWKKTTFANNFLAGTFSSGSNGTNSVNKLLWISGGNIPTTYDSKTPETFDYGTTIFESAGVWPEASPPASTNGMLVTTRLENATSISVAQYFYPAVNDTARPVYYRHAASNSTWQNWRKFSQTVI